MSDQPFPDASGVAGVDPQGLSGGAPPGGPTEEEMRAYVAQMRAAPVEQVVAEVLQGLLNAAQLKLGRRDGRLLLDLSAAITDNVRPHLSDDLAGQVDQALAQLRMAQVEAEGQVARSGELEQNDIGPAAADEGSSPDATPDEPPPGAPGSATSKLWIPGR